MPQAGFEQAIPVFRLAEIVIPYSQQASFGSEKKKLLKKWAVAVFIERSLADDNGLTGVSKMHNSM